MIKYTYGKPNIHWGGSHAKLVVGNFCSIANNCNVYLGGNHRTDWVTTYPFGHIHQNIFNNFNGEGTHLQKVMLLLAMMYGLGKM